MLMSVSFVVLRSFAFLIESLSIRAVAAASARASRALRGRTPRRRNRLSGHAPEFPCGPGRRQFLLRARQNESAENFRRWENTGYSSRASPRSSSCLPWRTSRKVRAMNARSRRRSLACDKRGGIHRIWRLRFSHRGGQFAIHENTAEAQTSKARGFRKSARDDQIAVPPNPRNGGDA